MVSGLTAYSWCRSSGVLIVTKLEYTFGTLDSCPGMFQLRTTRVGATTKLALFATQEGVQSGLARATRMHATDRSSVILATCRPPTNQATSSICASS